MSIKQRRIAPLFILVPIFLAAAACQGSVSVGSTPTVSKSDVAAQVSSSFSDQGLTATDVSCSDDLEGKVDASVTCTVTLDDGSTQDVTATVTSMDGETAKFSIDPVTDTPTP